MGLPEELLQRLLDIARQLTQERELDHLLEEIVRHSMALIVGSDFVCVFLYDVANNVLRPVAGVGFDMQILRQISLFPGESLTGQAFKQKRPLLFAGSQEVKQGQHNLRAENDRIVRLAVHRPDNPVRSSLSAPLRVGTEVVGALVIDNYDTDRDFTDKDLLIAEILADHAAVAVKNAQDYQRATQLSGQLRHLWAIHHQLLHSMMDPSGGLPSLVLQLHRLVKRPIALINRFGERVVECGVMELKQQRWVIRTGNEAMGTLLISGPPLTPMDKIIVEQTLPLLAIEQLKIESLFLHQLGQQGDLLQSLRQGENHLTHWHLRKLGLDPFRPVVFIAWRSTAPDDRAAMTLADGLHRMAGSLLTYGIVQGFTLGLFSFPQDVSSIHVSLQVAVPSVVGAVGPVCENSKDLPEHLEQTLALCQYGLGNPSLGGWLEWEEFPEVQLLLHLPIETQKRYVNSILQGILPESHLMETLTVWAQQNRSYASTAELLKTHVNTIRYRVDRIQQMLGKDFHNERTWFQIQLALWLSHWVDIDH